MQERICVFVDGGNFYHLALKKLGIEPFNFKFDSLVEHLAAGREVNQQCKRYYTGTVREKLGDQSSVESMSKQTRLFTNLKEGGWEIKTSKLRKRTEEVTVDRRTKNYEKLLSIGVEKIEFERWREKGIDVKIATDLIAGALDNKYDTATIISSDADLIPAIDWIRNRFNKKVEYVGFSIADAKEPCKSTKPLLSMISKTDLQRVLTEEELKRFI